MLVRELVWSHNDTTTDVSEDSRFRLRPRKRGLLSNPSEHFPDIRGCRGGNERAIVRELDDDASDADV
jgi:hypothetical protein